MSKSTRRGPAGRAGFEYIDRRQMGPWVVLRPLFRGGGLLITLVLAAVLIIGLSVHPFVVLGLLAAGFLGSFAVVWQGIGLLIRARAILVVAAVLVAGNLWFTAVFGDLVGNLLLVVLLGALFAFAPTRRYLVTRAWSVLDRHRIRACLKVCKIRAMNLDGALPFILWARPTKTGERVWLWIRAGASGDDIDDARSFIASACFARDARLHRVRSLSTLVAVEIVRRDPLGTGDLVVSPLSHLSTLVTGEVAGEGTEAIRAASLVEITGTDPAVLVPEPRKVRKSTPTLAVVPEGPAVVVSGEDLSDYVD